MTPNDPLPRDAVPDDDTLLEGVLRVHPDELVAFANDFFAAMDALRAGPGVAPSGAEGSPTA